MIELPSGIMFDVDGTLTESKQAITDEMALLVADLTIRMPVAIVSGASVKQIQTQIIAKLPTYARLESLVLFPTSGACSFSYEKGQWRQDYSLALTEEAKEKITKEVRNVLATHPKLQNVTLYGNQIEDRASSIAVSLLGQAAPINVKRTCDPDGLLRKELIRELTPLLSDFDLNLGGMTTIDITLHGIDKAYAVKQFSGNIGIPEETILYVGDALGENGNDSAVLKTAIQTHAVKNPTETEELIRSILTVADST